MSGNPTPTAPVAVTYSAPALRPVAEQLARELELALIHPPAEPDAPFVLRLTPQRLELCQSGPRAPGPVYVDFVGGRLGYRQRHGGGRDQPLARAIGLKGGANPGVIDATAGLGRDAFVLATLGCKVRMVERSPVIAALLRDGLRRALDDPELAPVVTERLSLHLGDAAAWLRDMPGPERPDVVYLDPMYPHRDKSALVKKEMRAFRALVGDDTDAPALLAAALGCARKRVVVKRPRLAPALAGPAPSFVISSPNTRYDVYVTALSAASNGSERLPTYQLTRPASPG